MELVGCLCFSVCYREVKLVNMLLPEGWRLVTSLPGSPCLCTWGIFRTYVLVNVSSITNMGCRRQGRQTDNSLLWTNNSILHNDILAISTSTSTGKQITRSLMSIHNLIIVPQAVIWESLYNAKHDFSIPQAVLWDTLSIKILLTWLTDYCTSGSHLRYPVNLSNQAT